MTSLLETEKRVRLVHRDCRDPAILIDPTFKGFEIERQTIVEGQDIKTYWSLSKKSATNPISKILSKTYF